MREQRQNGGGGSGRTKSLERNAMRTINEKNGINNDNQQ